MKRAILGSFFLSFLLACSSQGGIVDPPFLTDQFPSQADLTLTLLPAWTGLPSPIDAPFVGNGPTVVHRETTPFVQGGLDTIDIEMVSMDLVGSALGFPTAIRVGAGNGFFAGLEASLGQIQDTGGAPNGAIDFPADSFFDVFFDVWVDLDFDTIIDPGEVLRNVDAALRMSQPLLEDVPPPVGTQYSNLGAVQQADPNLGTFDATVLAAPIDLFPIDPLGSVIGPAHALLKADPGTHVHTVTPEPTTLAIWSLLGLAGIGVGWWRRRRKA